jgi:acetyltransferase
MTGDAAATEKTQPMKSPDLAAVAGDVHDVVGSRSLGLDAIFEPRSIAVIGASDRPGSVGLAMMRNLSGTFTGKLYPVNPSHENILGVPALATIRDVPGSVDLAVIAVPADLVPGVVAECAGAGVHAAVIISAGFRETGAAGTALEHRILELARPSRMRIVGPNCFGVMRPSFGLNATFAADMAKPGSVGFVSQSGALGASILDWAVDKGVGFSCFASVGSMLDVGWGDLIYYLGDDPSTKSIALYMESVGDARTFLSAAREVALSKPIIVIKAGRSDQAAKAAASHTGALTGSDAVLDAALARAGALRVNSIADLFFMVDVLDKQPRSKGRRLAIVTNAGGPAVLATDALVAGGGEPAPLSEATMAALDAALPAHWSHGDPIDVLGDADAGRWERALAIVRREPSVDGLLVILVPTGLGNVNEIAERVARTAPLPGKPMLAAIMGGPGVEAATDVMRRADVPTFIFPDTAANVFNYLWRYDSHLRGLYETPTLVSDGPSDALHSSAAEQAMAAARAARRTLLDEAESKAVLAAYDIPTVRTLRASSVREAAQRANTVGYPVVLKLLSPTITHKSDIGGVHLNLADEAAVCSAYAAIRSAAVAAAGEQAFAGVSVQPMVTSSGYELFIGSTTDSQFGPVIAFGLGGVLVEIFRDRALGLPPLTTTLARRVLEQTIICRALPGARGRAAIDLAALEQLLVRFSILVAAQRRIKEIDVNPLLASEGGFVALDARVILHDWSIPNEKLPVTAIRPYPSQYSWDFALRSGERVAIRPLRPDDEPLVVAFHANVSDQSRYYRYAHAISRDRLTTHERLSRVCFVDYARELALAAVRTDAARGASAIVGIARLIKSHFAREAEFAVLIADAYQRQGLGAELLRRMVEIGRAEDVGRIVGLTLPDNPAMLRTFGKMGFTITEDSTIGFMRAELAV